MPRVMSRKVAYVVVALAAVAAALAALAPSGQSSSTSWPFSVSSATLTQAGIDLSDPTTTDPGHGSAARAAVARLFNIPTTAVSYQHCVDRFAANPRIDQDCYVVQIDATKFLVPGGQEKATKPNRLSWFIGLVDPATGKVLETRGAG